MLSNLSKSVLGSTFAVLSLSFLTNVNRYRNEYKRKFGLKGNQFTNYNDEKTIEYNIKVNKSSNILLVFENGLGLPLESWDYLQTFLKDSYNILLYNRTGFGMTRSKETNGKILEKIIKDSFTHDVNIIFITHSIGSLAACNTIEETPFIKNITKKIIFLDGLDPYFFDEYRKDPQKKGEFIQTSYHKAFAGIFGFQWWGPDRYARRINYQPDIQQAVRLFEANPKEILATFHEYETIDTNSMKKVLSERNIPISIISSSERRSQQKKLSADFNVPFYVVENSSHYSTIGSPVHAYEVAFKLREIIND